MATMKIYYVLNLLSCGRFLDPACLPPENPTNVRFGTFTFLFFPLRIAQPGWHFCIVAGLAPCHQPK